MTQAWLTLLGTELKRSRLEQNLTLRDLAERIGVTQPTLIAAEAGSPNVKIGTYFEAAVILNIPLMGTLREIGDRTEANRAVIKLSPRPNSSDESSNDHQVPEFF
jgi:transcriptional regulator with XRE-family HTH domain